MPRLCGALVLSAEIGSSEREVRKDRADARIACRIRLLIHTHVLNISATYLCQILTSRERLLFSFVYSLPRPRRPLRSTFSHFESPSLLLISDCPCVLCQVYCSFSLRYFLSNTLVGHEMLRKTPERCLNCCGSADRVLHFRCTTCVSGDHVSGTINQMYPKQHKPEIGLFMRCRRINKDL